MPRRRRALPCGLKPFIFLLYFPIFRKNTTTAIRLTKNHNMWYILNGDDFAMKQRETLFINEKGRLQIGGIEASELAKRFSTPLYVMDEQYIRNICRSYYSVLKNEYPDSLVCFASKAFSCIAIYQIVSSENLGADVVSGGELYTALKSGMDPEKIYFHGNNKLKKELEEAVKAKVHAVVIDSVYETELLNSVAKENGVRQKVLIRVNPGIDAHTHQFVQTTRVDSKFGFSISDGAALEAAGAILKCANLEFAGIHCHIGSQIFELKPFEIAVEKMTDFIKKLKSELDITVKELNMGGGYGVTYTDVDKPLEPHQYVKTIVEKLKECIKSKNIAAPRLIFEPGRSIVGEAGLTLYSVGAIKEIKDVKKYISVDGGMFENPRFALYQAKYEAILTDKAALIPVEVYTVAGKCCESGDILVENAYLPKAESGDILAVLTTGAYNYSMAGNYNRNAVPPVVLVNGESAEYIVKPQTYEDIISRDIKLSGR